MTGTPPVAFRILGPFEVVLGDRLVDLGGRKARLLLATLVVHANQVVSTDRLFEVLWGPHPPASAANSVHSYVSHLRAAVDRRPDGQPRRLLVTRAPGYLLAVQPDQVDGWRFERLAAEGRELLAAGEPGQAVIILRDALALWRGDPLTEFTFAPFAQAEIVRLTELRLSALEDRVEADLANGAHAQLPGELARLVAEHPLRERFWGQLMVALYRGGRQADALRTFRRLRDTLAEQLGIDPSPAIVRLEEAILVQKPELEWPPSPGAVDSSRSARTTPPVGNGWSSPGRTTATEEPTSPAATCDAGRDAVARRAWQQAFELLSAADVAGALKGDDLDALADAALWVGRSHDSLAARQRAHAAFVEAGDRRAGGLIAVLLAVHEVARVRPAVAAGWLSRAQRLLAAEPDCVEHGYLAWARAAAAVLLGEDELDVALDQAGKAFDLACRFADPDLQALGLVFQGHVLVLQGQVHEGMGLMDEGMAGALSGGLRPLVSAIVICRTISTCQDVGDHRRAAEWMEAVEARFPRAGLAAFPGDCRAHQVRVLVLRGAWSTGELEARLACAEIEPFYLPHVGLAFAEIGQIRLCTGDLDRAEEAFRRAEELGGDPHPGTALVQLAKGNLEMAAAQVARMLADRRVGPLGRAKLLPAQVQVALAVGDRETAVAAAAELAALADTYRTGVLVAASECAWGRLHLEADDLVAAVARLRRGCALWRDVGAPHEHARAQVLLARALASASDGAAAKLELQEARRSFERLGAVLDAEQAARLWQDLERGRSGSRGSSA